MTGSERDRCMPDAERRVKEPGLVPETDAERTFDRSLAAWAATVALRRHARPHTTGEVRYPGKDLRRVRTVVGSGGVLRHSRPSAASHLVAGAIDDPAGGWQFPERANVVVDRRYVLAAAGLIGRHDPEAAMRLLASSLLD
jgi:uncharacterized protein (TIGR01319 family)